MDNIGSQKLAVFAALAAVCGVSWYYVMSKYNYSFFDWTLPSQNKISPINTTSQTRPHATQEKTQKSIYQEAPILLTLDNFNKLIEQKNKEKKERAEEIARGTTELHKACRENDIERVRDLLSDPNTDVNAKEHRIVKNNQERGTTPLHIACWKGSIDIVRLLLCHRDTDVSIRHERNYTPLSSACLEGNIEIVQLLLEHKTSILNSKKPLYNASACGHFEIVELLLTYNQDNCLKINNVMYNNCNALSIACTKKAGCAKKSNIEESRKFLKIIKALLQDPAICLKHAFHTAATDEELLKLFLEKNESLEEERKCSINVQDNGGNTPLHHAAKVGNLLCVFLLLQCGADISIQNRQHETPFQTVCEHAVKDSSYNKNIVTKLLDSEYVTPAIVNSSDCLFDCMRYGNKSDVITQLLLYGADPNKKCRGIWGYSPVLRIAGNNLSLLNLCIDQYGGDITQTTLMYETPWYFIFTHNCSKDPNDINCFKHLDVSGKKEFMKRELLNVARFRPYVIERYQNDVNEKLLFLNRFVKACIKYGKVDINEKIETGPWKREKRLLDIAYEKLNKRSTKFNSTTTRRAGRYAHCMHPNKNFCDVMGNNGNRCRDCEESFKYNEAIVHVFLQHTDLTKDDPVEYTTEKALACMYYQGKDPLQYYKKSEEEKSEIKELLVQCLASQV